MMKKLTGIGDAISLVAKPIARAIDSVVGTDLEHCADCAERQDYLNQKFPFKTDAAPPLEKKPETVIAPCLGCGRK